VSGVKIADSQNVMATYPVAVVKDSQNSAVAKAWVLFLESKVAQRTLRKFGFLPP
jgi:molybdate transport system substrate-binding protein